MPTLPAFPGNTSLTISELLALEGTYETWTLVVAVETVLYMKHGYDDTANLTEQERVLLAVLALEHEVMNGGYSQFFTNSSVEFAPMIVDALREIGCPNTADLTRQAIETLELDNLTEKAIKMAAQRPDDQRDELLHEYDRVFFRYEERLDLKLFSYIRANHEFIRIP